MYTMFCLFLELCLFLMLCLSTLCVPVLGVINFDFYAAQQYCRLTPYRSMLVLCRCFFCCACLLSDQRWSLRCTLSHTAIHFIHFIQCHTFSRITLSGWGLISRHCIMHTFFRRTVAILLIVWIVWMRDYFILRMCFSYYVLKLQCAVKLRGWVIVF